MGKKAAPTGAYLKFDDAVMLMHRRESRLVKMHCKNGAPPKFYIAPRGGAVKPDDAEKIMARLDVRGMKDGLFPGLDQTWRMVR
jgi:hypothetical protein